MTTATPPTASGAPALPPSGPGLFISFERGDGIGKTTQIRALVDFLTAVGVNHALTRESGDTEPGAEIRRFLLHGGHVAPRVEVLLYAADRAHHIATRVQPALERGAVVLVDRYLDSSVAYQDVIRSFGPQEVRDLSLWTTEGLLSDLAVLFDGDPDPAERRAIGRGARDRPEREGDAFRAVLREQFLTLAEGEPERFAVVDVDRPVDQVTDDAIEAAVAAVRRHGARLTHGGAHQGVLLGLEAFVEAAARRSAARSSTEVRS